jgi:peptidoglycan/LPS O-acetylase OafA/YrhL
MSQEMPVQASKAPSRLEFIDISRGLACLLVLIHHEHELLPPLPQLGPLLEPAVSVIRGAAWWGYLGVHLFLVLSGFCLMWPLVRSGSLSSAPLNLKEFIQKRAQRILPPYYVALALFCTLSYLAPSLLQRPTVWWDIPVHLLCLQNCFPQTVTTSNTAFWSLGLEVQLYAAFPLVILLIRRVGLRKTLGATLVLALLWQALMHELHPKLSESLPDFAIGVASYYALPGRLFEFVCGMGAALLVARQRTAPVPSFALFALGLMTLNLLLIAQAPPQFGPVFGCWFDQLWGITFALIIVEVGRRSEAPWLSQLPARALKGLGTISFSVYLVHLPLLQLISSKLSFLELSPTATFAVALFVILPFLVIAGRVFYRLVEAPQQFRKPKPQSSLLKSKTIS